MKKALFICNTSYQILFTINFVSVMNEYEVGIFLTDTLPNADKLKEKLFALGCFLEVKIVKFKEMPRLSSYKKVICYYLQKYFNFNFVKVYFNPDFCYDELYFANFNEEIAYIRRYLMKRNSNLITNMYEDGFATYSSFYYETLHEFLEPKNYVYKVIRKRIYDNYYAIKKMLVFNPQYMVWQTNKFKIEKIIFQSTKNSQFVKQICDAFDVNTETDIIKQKYIFFEESYCSDNREINDIELVRIISDIVGKDNIYVKTHPRNKVNRFLKEGFITNIHSSAPWEIMAIINNLEDKVLFTIASVSVLTPRVLFGVKYKGFMLYKCAEPEDSLRQDIIPTYEQIRNNFSNDVQVPEKLKDMIQLIKNDFENKEST